VLLLQSSASTLTVYGHQGMAQHLHTAAQHCQQFGAWSNLTATVCLRAARLAGAGRKAWQCPSDQASRAGKAARPRQGCLGRQVPARILAASVSTEACCFFVLSRCEPRRAAVCAPGRIAATGSCNAKAPIGTASQVLEGTASLVRCLCTFTEQGLPSGSGGELRVAALSGFGPRKPAPAPACDYSEESEEPARLAYFGWH